MTNSSQELSLDFINQLMLLQLPPVTTAKAGWRFDHDAILTTCGGLGLKHAVRIRFTSAGTKRAKGENLSGSTTYGAHRILVDYTKDTLAFYHGITISQILKFDFANQYLWHELRHAQQAERITERIHKPLSEFHRIYKNADGNHGSSYVGNKFELDANAFAKRMVAEGKYLLIPKPERVWPE